LLDSLLQEICLQSQSEDVWETEGAGVWCGEGLERDPYIQE